MPELELVSQSLGFDEHRAAFFATVKQPVLEIGVDHNSLHAAFTAGST
jgi:hypothetical protein